MGARITFVWYWEIIRRVGDKARVGNELKEVVDVDLVEKRMKRAFRTISLAVDPILVRLWARWMKMPME